MSKKIAFASLVLATALGTTLLGASSAAAQTSGQIVQRKVTVSDLNLSSPTDAHTLLYRIRRAAIYVCGSGGLSPLQRISGSHESCVRSATSTAVAKVNSPLVTAMYGGDQRVEVATK